MTDFRVPKEFRAGLVQIGDLSESAVLELCGLLEENQEVLISRSAAFESARKLREIPPEDAPSLIEALVPLLYWKSSNNEPVEEIVRDVQAELQRGGKGDGPKLEDDRIESFGKNLSRLLRLSGVALKAKAISIAADVPRLFSETRILSDIRPIFGDKPAQQPVGATLVHNLRISYSEDGNEHQFFVQLDTRDLRNVQECVNRALEKDTALRSLLDRIKLRIFETF
jgi:hypothetical protein